MQGIAKYSSLHGPWTFQREFPFYYKESECGEGRSFHPNNWEADGIIMVNIPRQKKVEKIIETGLPMIAKGLKNPIKGVPNILTDSVATGKMAADYLLSRGFTHFGYCGVDEMFWSRNRAISFGEEIAKFGFETSYYQRPRLRLQRSWEKEHIFIAKWLKSLPKPVGLFACNDDRGQHVIEACKMAGLCVPDEVAILGVDNDHIICDLTDPPLSSIELNVKREGYKAAETLDKLMMTKKLKGDNMNIIVQPSHVVTRQSTDILAIDDREVSAAVRFIRTNAKKPIRVIDVTDALVMSRRNLERRFYKALGRTILDEIKKVRLEQINKLLLETNIPIIQVATNLGFTDIKQMNRFFKLATGMTPRAYRMNNSI